MVFKKKLYVKMMFHKDTKVMVRPPDDDSQCLVKRYKVKLSPFSRGRPEGSLFNSYYTEV